MLDVAVMLGVSEGEAPTLSVAEDVAVEAEDT